MPAGSRDRDERDDARRRDDDAEYAAAVEDEGYADEAQGDYDDPAAGEYDEYDEPAEDEDDREERAAPSAPERRRGRPDRLNAAEAAREGLRRITALTAKTAEGVTSVEPAEDGWIVGVELLDAKRIPSSSDTLALYEVEIDTDGELTSYRRVARYSRARGSEAS